MRPAVLLALRTLLTVVVASLGGGLAEHVGIPLPWVLGSMLGTAVVTLTGAGAHQPMALRRAAQVVIGSAMGLTFTPAVLREVMSLWYGLLLGTVFSIGLSMLFARVIQLLAGLDGPTAVYSSAAGASTEMALQGQRAGADGALVASVHAVRIILVVSLASFVAYFSGEVPGAYISANAPAPGLKLVLVLLFLAPLAGWLAARAGLPSAWLLGPVLLTGLIAANGWTQSRMYPLALIGAQIAIGWSLGQHMTRAFFMKSPRVLASAMVMTVSMLALCVMVAWGVSHSGPMSLLTVFLAIAPGGLAEMTIIAKTYGIGAPIVTAFHLFRVICAVLTIGWVARFLLRSGWVRAQAHPTP
jgi:membrane AbrB-like protein